MFKEILLEYDIYDNYRYRDKYHTRASYEAVRIVAKSRIELVHNKLKRFNCASARLHNHGPQIFVPGAYKGKNNIGNENGL